MLLIFCFLAGFSSCEDIEDEVVQAFSKYEPDETIAWKFSGTRLCFSDYEIYSKDINQEDDYCNAMIIYNQTIYYGYLEHAYKDNAILIYKSDLRGENVSLAFEFDDHDYDTIYAYDKTFYLEYKNGEVCVDSFNVETQEKKHYADGKYASACELEARRRDGFRYEKSKSELMITLKGENITIDEEMLKKYDFGREILSFDGVPYGAQWLRERLFVEYCFSTNNWFGNRCVIVLEYNLNDGQLSYSGIFFFVDGVSEIFITS